MTRKTGTLPAAAVVASPLPAAAVGAYAQAGPGEAAQAPCSIEDIAHSFAVMEDHVVYDRDKNISFDMEGALRDGSVSRTDIDIALDFAAHSNSILNAAIGPVARANEADTGNAELAREVRILEDGKFRLLFEEDAGPVAAAGAPQGLAGLAMPLSSHGESDAAPQAPRRGGPNPLTVCGGGGMSNPHPWKAAVLRPTGRTFPSSASAKTWALRNAYHYALPYATDHYLDDFARIDTTAPDNCNSGPFREQAVLTAKGTGSKFNMPYGEPNPELSTYAWPRLWWGAYTYWWHVTDGGTKPSP